MKIYSSDKKSYVSLELNTDTPDEYPNCSLFVSLDDRGFSGSNTVWLERDELQVFLVAFRECERTRRGTAQLLMTTGVTLTFSPVDSLGHYRVDYLLERNT